jgi:uroporphyrinogen decarboxylase
MSADDMSHAERIKSAIDFKEPDRVPMFDSMTWSVNMAGKNLGLIGQKVKDVSFPKWIHNPDIFVESQIKALDRFDHDFVHSRMSSHILAEPMGCREEEPYWDVPATINTAINRVEDWKTLKFPNMDKDGKIPTQLTAIRMLDKELHEKRGDDVFITGFVRGAFTLAEIVLGVERFMDFCNDVSIECIKAQIDAGADHIYTPDPSASAALISAKFYHDFALPAAQKQSAAIRKYKDKYAHHYHICGDTRTRWDDLAKIGASYVSLDYMISLKEAKENIGKKTAIAGNMSPAGTLLLGTPGMVEEEGKQMIRDAAVGGGYIYWAGCDLPIDCPIENVDKFFEVPKVYGKYPIEI